MHRLESVIDTLYRRLGEHASGAHASMIGVVVQDAPCVWSEDGGFVPADRAALSGTADMRPYLHSPPKALVDAHAQLLARLGVPDFPKRRQALRALSLLAEEQAGAAIESPKLGLVSRWAAIASAGASAAGEPQVMLPDAAGAKEAVGLIARTCSRLQYLS